MWNLLDDVRSGFRLLKHNPGFATVAVATLSLGIAANATVFGWIDTVLLRPIPGVGNAKQLAALEVVSAGGSRTSSCTHPDFRDFQRELTLASGVVATHIGLFTVGSGDRPRRVMGQIVSANFFAVLGVKPFLGRLFLPEEDRDEPGGQPIAVVSHRLWRTYFRSDPDIAGRVVRINGRQITIAGVASEDFRGSVGGAALDIWMPLSMAVEMGTLNTWASADRNARFLDLIVRLKPGVTIEQAGHEVRAVAGRIASAHPQTHRGTTACLTPIWMASQGLQSVLRDPLRILMLVSVLVLLIACANVANLLLTRSVARRREFGVRVALGAGRWKLVRQLLTEALPVAAAAAVIGLLLAQWMEECLHLVFPTLDSQMRAAVQPLLNPEPNLRVLLFTALAAACAAGVSSILPALRAGRGDVNVILKEGSRGGTPGGRSQRAMAVVVVFQVALAAVSLAGAMAAVRGFRRLLAVDPGFDARNVLAAHFYLSSNGYSLEQEKNFCRNLRLRLEGAPGIDQAGYADSVPLSLFSPSAERVQVEGSAADLAGVRRVSRTVVAPGYFSLMRIPILRGRDFTEQDDATSPRVIIVNETFAARYFGRDDPIGRKVRVSGAVSTVVGVVKDSQYRTPRDHRVPFFYGPFRQIFFSGHNNFFYIRANGDIEAARAALRREASALDPNIGLYDVAPLAEYTQASLLGERVIASLLSVLGLLSLTLAAVGLYSVMAYAVSERTHEIGIRMALGAQRRQVIGAVLTRGLALTLAGAVCGTAGAAVLVRVASSRLNAVPGEADPVVFAASAGFLVLIALAACYVPAWRATKVDPLSALRSE